jgi:hypothetical protein
MAGRYSTLEIEMLRHYSQDLEVGDIKLLLQDHGFIRSEDSIIKKIAEIQQEDKIRKAAQAKERANKDIVKYRAKSLFNGAKARAKDKGLVFSLNIGWVEEKMRAGKCEATGMSFVFTEYGHGTTKTNPYAPSLDRIDSNGGYTLDNTQVVLSAFNKFKSDMVQHEIIDIAKAIVKHHMKGRQFTVDS